MMISSDRLLRVALPSLTRGMRTGRPRGAPPNRQAILEAAQQQFSERGYSGATIRRIAAAAGIDAALVHHYFGSKDELLLAAMQPDDTEITAQLIRGRRRDIGARFVRSVLQVYECHESGGHGTLLGLLRSAATHEDAARVLRESLDRGGVAQLLEGLQVSQPRLRAALVATELAGLVMARYVVRLEPIASLDVDTLAALFGPVFQRFIVGPLPAT